MGGHHQHESRGSSTRSGSWEGYEALRKALDGLATAKGVSQSRIGAVAKLAAQNAKSYKHVVHDIEVFLWKAEVEHRLAGLYAIDAIIRQSHAKSDPKDMYIKRFLIRLADTIAAVKKVPEQSQSRVRHVIEEWQKRGVYTAAQLEAAGGRAYIWSEGDSAEAQTSDRRAGNVTPRTSPGKLASLLSILKKKKEEHEYVPQPSQQLQQPPYEAAYDNQQGGQGGDAGHATAYAHERRSYEERPTDEQQYGRREVGGIMGDAPGVPVGSGRTRRAPEEAENSRGTKKPRGSRWGPPKMANAPQSERPAPIITSQDRASEFASGRSAYVSPAGRPESSRQPPLLRSPPRGVAPRSDEWNRGLNRPMSGSHAAAAGSAWPPNESVRSPQSAILSQAMPDGRLDYGYARTGRNEAARFEQGGGVQSPYPRNGDRQSPHQPQGPPGDHVPGASGQLCRKFLSGKCTFGDRCWNVHDPQALQSGRPHTEMDEAKRKTVLCNNFPLGTCRFGDKCSFAHGYDDLDNGSSRAAMHGGRDGIDDSAGRRWRASPNAQSGGRDSSQLAPSVHNATASVAPQQARPPYGAAQAVYNEPQGDRGSSGGGASSMFYANGAAPSPGGRRLPPDHLPTSTTGQQGSQPMYTSAPSGYATQGIPYSSGIGQVPASMKPSPSSQTYPTASIGGNAAVATGSKALADDDDGDTAEPEFTLQYDDDD